MGGSDQWGNITTGTELIRRKEGGEAYALTCPLITKADGGKFGKTEQGNVWLDAKYTSPYKFYQFWLNVSDEDAQRYVKIFTMLDKQTIDTAIEAHLLEPHKRELQKLLAKEVTTMVHGEEASGILFGNSTSEALRGLDEDTFLTVFEGVPQFSINKDDLKENIVELLAVKSSVFPSKGECRKMVQGGGVSINKEKADSPELIINESELLNNKYILIQRGKKNYYILKVD
jgi:tyrosyl-tRNA synthetase